MDTVKLLWAFLWRMVLWGIALVTFAYPAYTVLRSIGHLGLGVWILIAFYPDAYAFLRPPGRPTGISEVSVIVREVLIPTLLFSGAMWWAGRRVAWRLYVSPRQERAG
jgi:hypothetical protein